MQNFQFKNDNAAKRTADQTKQTQSKQNPFLPNNAKSVNPFLPIQTKLNIGQSNDKYEQEADKVADKVVNQTPEQVQKQGEEEELQTKPMVSGISSLVQKEGIEEEEIASAAPDSAQMKMIQKEGIEEEVGSAGALQAKMIQKEGIEEEVGSAGALQAKMIQKEGIEEEEIASAAPDSAQMKGKEVANGKTQNKSEASPKVESQINQAKGNGNQLDGKIKNKMESGFGVDFGQVKIHNDSKSAQLSQELNAQAFTVGNDVFFNQGKYNPQSTEGQTLLAHELTHVVQQNKGTIQEKKKD